MKNSTNPLNRFSANSIILFVITVKQLIDILISIFSDLTLIDLLNYSNVSSVITLILLVIMFKNIFRTEKRTDENYLSNKFNEIRSIRTTVPECDHVPMYNKDLIAEKNFIVQQLIEDKKIIHIYSEQQIKKFVEDKYHEFYKISKVTPM